MQNENAANFYRRPVAVAAAVAVSLSALFVGTPVGIAEPYGDDDDGGSSYSSGDDGGGMEEPSGGGMEEPSGGGMEEPSGGGMEDPSDDGLGGDEPSGGGMQEPGGGGMEEPSGGGMHDPGGDEPAGGGMQEPGGGGMEEPSGGGMHDPSGDEPSGGGMHDPSGGGGMMKPAESEAPAKDVATAKGAEVVSTSSTEASSEEISSYRESIESTFSSSTLSTTSVLSSPVRQWNSRWTTYDPFYRPVFTNPYQLPLQVMYDYGGKPQTFTVPPLQRAAIDVPNAGVYNFTSMTRSPNGKPTNVSVGSFSGGGFKPAPGQAPPQKPPALKTIKNALVQVKFTAGSSDPFRVSSLNDLGKDAAVSGATKVLLDGEVPAWGQWAKSAKGEDLFQITETQLLPGVKPPAQEPLPGYKVKLVASEHSTKSWFEENKTMLIGVAAGAGLLALAAVGFLVARRRRTVE